MARRSVKTTSLGARLTPLLAETAFDGLRHTPLLFKAPVDIPDSRQGRFPTTRKFFAALRPSERERAVALVQADRKGTHEPAHDLLS